MPRRPPRDTLFPGKRCNAHPTVRQRTEIAANPIDGTLESSEPRVERLGPREAREIHHRTLPDHDIPGPGKAGD